MSNQKNVHTKKRHPRFSLSLSLVFFFHCVGLPPSSRLLGVSVYTAGALGGVRAGEEMKKDSRVGVFFGGGTCLKGRLGDGVDCLFGQGRGAWKKRTGRDKPVREKMRKRRGEGKKRGTGKKEKTAAGGRGGEQAVLTAERGTAAATTQRTRRLSQSHPHWLCPTLPGTPGRRGKGGRGRGGGGPRPHDTDTDNRGYVDRGEPPRKTKKKDRTDKKHGTKRKEGGGGRGGRSAIEKDPDSAGPTKNGGT